MLVGQSCTPSTLLVYEERGGIQKELESAVINQKVDQTAEGNIEKIKQNYMRAGHYLGLLDLLEVPWILHRQSTSMTILVPLFPLCLIALLLSFKCIRKISHFVKYSGYTRKSIVPKPQVTG